MKVSDTLAVIERFFLDVIGCVLPGIFMLALASFLFELHHITRAILDAKGLGLFLVVGASYALGHFLTFVGDTVTERVYSMVPWVLSKIQCLSVTEQITSKQLQKDLLASQHYMELKQSLIDHSIVSKNYAPKRANDVRNLALSVEGVDKNLAHRFMFLALFNITTASAILVVVVAWHLAHFLRGRWPEFLWGDPPVPEQLQLYPYNWCLVAVSVFLFWGLVNRFYRFYGISFRMPVSDALMKISKMAKSGIRTDRTVGSNPVVYLAGGFRSGWQSKVISEFHGNAAFLDPSAHGLSDPGSYTSWDLDAIDRSSIVFAYLECSNPGGYALACEVGYAKAQGKVIIVIDEKSQADGGNEKYLDMVKECAGYSVQSFDEGMEVLRQVLAMHCDANRASQTSKTATELSK